MKITSKAAALTLAVVIAAAGSFGAFRYASAQEGGSTVTATPTAKRDRGDDFVSHLAANLNVSPDQLRTAIKNAALQTVDDRVADGTLPPDQAAKIKERINSGKGLELGALFGKHRHEERGERIDRFRHMIIESAAKAIGVQPKDLVAELKGGKSIADAALEHNVSLDTVKSQITSDAHSKLSALVSEKKITQDQANAIMQQLSAHLDQILNRHKGDKH